MSNFIRIMCKKRENDGEMGVSGCATVTENVSEYTTSDNLRYFERRMGFKTNIVWSDVVIITLMHVLVPWVFFSHAFPVKWQTPLFNYLIYVISSFGVSGGVHRYWSHRSYSAAWPLRLILMLSFAISGQKTIYAWVRDHRVHHKYTDTNADPHNIKRGFFFAHIGANTMRRHPEMIKRGEQVDMSDIINDPIASFHDRHYGLIQVCCCILFPICFPILWGEGIVCASAWRCACFLIGTHCTWAINSFAHAVGSRPFNRHIQPTDNKFLAWFLADEGYHNYHHTFPWDYSTSELGYVISVSITTPLLDAFKKIGWAYGLKQPSRQLVSAIADRRGDGTSSSLLDKLSVHHDHEEIPEGYELTAESTATKTQSKIRPTFS